MRAWPRRHGRNEQVQFVRANRAKLKLDADRDGDTGSGHEVGDLRFCWTAAPHLAILKAIGAGAHTLEDISNATLIGKTHLSSYLVRLQDLKFIERRLPATIASAERLRSRKGRYHLRDPYFRFYFRFMAPAHEQAGLSREQLWSRIQQDLRLLSGRPPLRICRGRGCWHKDRPIGCPLCPR